MTLDYGSWPVALFLLQAGLVLVVTMLVAVVFERTAFAISRFRGRRLNQRYGALVRAALDGDDAAVRVLAARPRRHLYPLAVLIIAPLIEDRDPARIARTRDIARVMLIGPLVDRLRTSVWWWRRAIGLRALGLVQVRARTAAIVAALDDDHPDVRAAALDALTDLQDPASLQAIVVRLHDASLPRGRRAAALTAFGHQCEGFLLELANVDPRHRVNYAKALTICGTGQSRQMLCDWATDARPEVRAAAFEALAHTGLDDRAGRIALDGLGSSDPTVRAMAAFALRGWTGAGETAAALAPRLDDSWPVAVQAARSLRSLGSAGLAALRARADRAGLPGTLARQMLWEAERSR